MRTRERPAVIALCCLLVLTVSASTGRAGIPELMSFQGRLYDAQDQPLAGDHTLAFALYETASGGSAIWVETHSAVEVSDGYFSVLLGGTTPLLQEMFDGDRYLGVSVDGAAELAPRYRLAAVAYSFVAAQAESCPNWAVNGSDVYATNLGGVAIGMDIASYLYKLRVESDSGERFSSAVHGHAASTSGEVYGGYFRTESSGSSAAGVKGEAVATSGSISGVWGYTNSPLGVGVLGHNHASSSDAYGGFFRSDSGSGIGVKAITNGTYGFYTPDAIYVGNGLADIAEHVDVIGEVEPGDVVALAPQGGGLATRSTVPNDRTVLGIISTSPALLLGDSESQSPLAIAGRVPCKVSCENGPILPGDLLCASSLPGHAMRAESVMVEGFEIYRPGTIVAKAIEGLAEGTGKILVQVMLQ